MSAYLTRVTPTLGEECLIGAIERQQVVEAQRQAVLERAKNLLLIGCLASSFNFLSNGRSSRFPDLWEQAKRPIDKKRGSRVQETREGETIRTVLDKRTTEGDR